MAGNEGFHMAGNDSSRGFKTAGNERFKVVEQMI